MMKTAAKRTKKETSTSALCLTRQQLLKRRLRHREESKQAKRGKKELPLGIRMKRLNKLVKSRPKREGNRPSMTPSLALRSNKRRPHRKPRRQRERKEGIVMSQEPRIFKKPWRRTLRVLVQNETPVKRRISKPIYMELTTPWLVLLTKAQTAMKFTLKKVERARIKKSTKARKRRTSKTVTKRQASQREKQKWRRNQPQLCPIQRLLSFQSV
jgi:hypothetical protein